MIGARQLSSCASATAVSRFPTPSGPVKMTLGGSDSAFDRADEQLAEMAVTDDRRAAASG